MWVWYHRAVRSVTNRELRDTSFVSLELRNRPRASTNLLGFQLFGSFTKRRFSSSYAMHSAQQRLQI